MTGGEVVLEPVVPVTVSVGLGVLARLRSVVAAQEERRVVLSSADRWQTSRLPRSEAARVRARWREEVERLRGAGRLLDTRDVLVGFGVQLELAARGWDHDQWPQLPQEAVERGRWPGSRDLGVPEKLAVRLPASLVLRVRAGCWFTSVEAIAALRRWRDAHPDVVVPRAFDEQARPTGPLGQYEELAARVTAPGVVWRAGVDRGLAHAEALPPLPTG